MSKITVTEYAKKYQITRQTVYNRIKKGLLESIEENDTTLVFDDIKEVSRDSKKDDCQKLVKKLMKRIDKLEDRLEKSEDQKLELAMSYVNEMKSLYLPKPKTKNLRKRRNRI